MSSGGSVGEDRPEVTDAGPLIHLGQVGRLKVFEAVSRVLVSREVIDEIGSDTLMPKNAQVIESDPTNRDLAGLISGKHGLGLGESSAIALCRQERIPLF